MSPTEPQAVASDDGDGGEPAPPRRRGRFRATLTFASAFVIVVGMAVAWRPAYVTLSYFRLADPDPAVRDGAARAMATHGAGYPWVERALREAYERETEIPAHIAMSLARLLERRDRIELASELAGRSLQRTTFVTPDGVSHVVGEDGVLRVGPQAPLAFTFDIESLLLTGVVNGVGVEIRAVPEGVGERAESVANIAIGGGASSGEVSYFEGKPRMTFGLPEGVRGRVTLIARAQLLHNDVLVEPESGSLEPPEVVLGVLVVGDVGDDDEIGGDGERRRGDGD